MNRVSAKRRKNDVHRKSRRALRRARLDSAPVTVAQPLAIWPLWQAAFSALMAAAAITLGWLMVVLHSRATGCPAGNSPRPKKER